MTYTAYNGKTARLSSASSKDLIKWKKHGPVLKDKKYRPKAGLKDRAEIVQKKSTVNTGCILETPTLYGSSQI